MVLGGLGTVGSLVARWLALSAPPGSPGAHLVLVGRSGRYATTADPRAAPHADRASLSAAVALIELARGDVACAEDARLHCRGGGRLREARPEYRGSGPMSGVVHAGGVLRDAT
eukprot:242965-Pyramimonas_sp.AAC.1